MKNIDFGLILFACLLASNCSSNDPAKAPVSTPGEMWTPGAEKNYAGFQQDDKYGFLDITTNKTVIPAQFEWVGTFSEGRAPYGERCDPKRYNRCQKYGYIDPTGKTVIEPIYKRKPGQFHHNRACVFADGLYGFIDREGKMVIEPQFTFCTTFRNGFAPVYLSGQARDLKVVWLAPAGDVRTGHINTDGKLITPPKYTSVSHFSETVASVCTKTGAGNKTKCGLIDSEAKQILPSKYAYLGLRKEGFSVFGLAGRYGFIDADGKVTVEAKYKNLEAIKSGLAVASRQDKYGAIDKAGKWVIEPRFSELSDFHSGLARFKLTENGSYGYVNQEGKIAIEATYPYATSFVSGIAAVRKKAVDGSKQVYGLINSSGKFTVEPKFQDINLPSHRAQKKSLLAGAPKDSVRIKDHNSALMSSVGIKAPIPIKPVDQAKVLTHMITGPCLFYSMFAGTPEARRSKAMDLTTKYLKNAVPAYAKALRQTDDIPSDLVADVTTKVAIVCKAVAEFSSGQLYTSIATLKANYGVLKGRWSDVYVLGAAKPDTYYNCDFDDRSMLRSYKLEGIEGREKINIYCKSYEPHCKLMQNATSDGKPTLGLYKIRYPRSNSVCSDGQAHLTSVSSYALDYEKLFPKVETEVQKLIAEFNSKQNDGESKVK